jgi:DNA-directed RNA polymerase
VLPYQLARQILSGKRGIRATTVHQAAEVAEVEGDVAHDDESSIDDFLAVEEDPTKPEKKTRKVKAANTAFVNSDGTPIEVLEFDGKAFVRFADVLPPCPPKGEFDVNKIRLSPYFFS